LVAGHIYVEAKTQQGLLRAKRLFEAGIQKKRRDEAAYEIQGRRAWFDLWLDEEFRQWFNIEETLDKIQCPALVIQGTQDEYANVSQAGGLPREFQMPVCVWWREPSTISTGASRQSHYAKE
jgi:pimeloyl-ACP methyl ester carboxylesterase